MDRLKMPGHGTDGLLMTFCGLDGCGKSTMIKRLSDWLSKNKKEMFLTKQPTDFVRKSDIFRTYMDEPDHTAFDYRSLSLMAASDRIQHSNKVILPQLQMGKVVISDRYIYSCVANLRARGYTKDKWIREVSKWIVKPDAAFFLDVPVETAVKRVRSRKEEKNRYIDMELQYRLREEYLKLCRENGGILLRSDGTEEETFKEMKKYLLKFMEEEK